MQIGDVAVPNRKSISQGKFLHCGSGVYSHAIVGSVEPFMLVSDTGDMVWSCTWNPEDMEFLCQASKEIINVVKKRLDEDKKRG